MSLLLNMLSRLVITFLLRSKCLLISWLQSPSAVILEPQKKKSDTVSTVSPSVSHEVMGPDNLIVWLTNLHNSSVCTEHSTQGGLNVKSVLLSPLFRLENWGVGDVTSSWAHRVLEQPSSRDYLCVVAHYPSWLPCAHVCQRQIFYLKYYLQSLVPALFL